MWYLVMKQTDALDVRVELVYLLAKEVRTVCDNITLSFCFYDSSLNKMTTNQFVAK